MSQSSRGAVYDTLPELLPAAFPGHSEERPLELPELSPRLEAYNPDLVAPEPGEASDE